MTDHLPIKVLHDEEALARETANRFAAIAERSIANQGVFRVALSGGNTPRRTYELLAEDPYRRRVDWRHTQVVFSDERFVPPDSPESNYRMTKEELLTRVPLPERLVHPVPTVDISPEESASLYEERIRRVFEVGLDEIPVFDLIMLGLGPDGHTASLFPGTEALAVSDHLVAANFVPHLQAWRITFTYPLINAARDILFQVQGGDKSDAIAAIFGLREDLPAGRVHPTQGNLTWLLDEAAAAKLTPPLPTT